MKYFRVVLLVAPVLGIVLIAALFSASSNTHGVAADTRHLPLFANELGDLPCDGGIAWHLHRDRLTHRYFFVLSSKASSEELMTFCDRHHLEFTTDVSKSEEQPFLNQEKRYNDLITTKFDVRDPVFNAYGGPLGNIRLYHRLRDQRFTLTFAN